MVFNNMNPELLTIIINAIATPVLVLLTMWIRNSFSTEERRQKREDGFIDDLRLRIEALEKELKVVKVELKNRDAEYVELFQKYTTLKAQYEVLQVDHNLLKKQYDQTVAELARLGTTVKV